MPCVTTTKITNPPSTYYTYKISSISSEKYYYGVRRVKIENASIEECLADKYFGSGGYSEQNKFKNWKRKHRLELTKEIIARFQVKEEAFKAEAVLVGDLWKTDLLCLNSCSGGRGDTPGFAAQRIHQKSCLIHGQTKHQGDKCRRCIAQATVTLRVCLVHGEVKHAKDICYKCMNRESKSLKNCLVHGLAKHSGKSCGKCVSEQRTSAKICEFHGLGTFHGESCVKCYTQKAITIENCAIHGTGPHRAFICAKCAYSKGPRTVELCRNHGEQEFTNGKCRKCWSSKAYTLAICQLHGESKHQNEICVKCSSAANSTSQNCKIHGLVKHRGKTCSSCTIAKTLATRKERHGY